jgi:DNA-binding XRE family transcriptional regulator
MTDNKFRIIIIEHDDISSFLNLDKISKIMKGTEKAKYIYWRDPLTPPSLIKEARKIAKLTQDDITKYIKMDRSNYSRKETGKGEFTFNEILKILDFLSVHLPSNIMEDLRRKLIGLDK